MISLDEEYIGMDPNTIIARGLIVCGAIFCNINNGNLLGTHFTNAASQAEIVVGCNYLREHFLGGAIVTEMYFVGNLAAWQGRSGGIDGFNQLMNDIKILFNYRGNINVSDTHILRYGSVDVRFDSGGAGRPARITYRQTLSADPLIITLTDMVKKVKTPMAGGVLTGTPIVVSTRIAPWFHQLPTNTSGFVPFDPGMFVPV